jgi:RNA methyltransferase, TrmH family
MIPLSKSKAKYIKSLQLKKNRMQEGKFIVEGQKSVLEFLDSDFIIEEVVGTEEFYAQIDKKMLPEAVFVCNSKILSKIGKFYSNNGIIAIVRMKEPSQLSVGGSEVVLALDNINDPGNLGTIIRVADWYGIDKLLLTKNSVDVYNPKVVSASKGSLTRVGIFYVDLAENLAEYKGPVYAADMQGESLANVPAIKSGVLLMGSESHGISKELHPYITKRVTIPRKGGAESLNVAVATGIICNYLLG